jgi:hypothetical protein
MAQTASYGILPNPAMPQTFLAQAYDRKYDRKQYH